MRKLVLFFGFGPFLFLDQCGGDCDCGGDGGNGSDAMADAAKNDAASLDAANDVVVSDAGLACTSPTGCGANTPLCCGTVVLNGGTPPNCMTSSITSECAAQCTPAFVTNCSGIETVQLCAQATDCKDAIYDKCCTFTSGSESLTFCSTQTIANGAGAKCK